MPKKLGLDALQHIEETTGRITQDELGQPRRGPLHAPRANGPCAKESSVDTPVIRRVSATGKTLTEVLCQLQKDGEPSVSIDIHGKVHYGKKIVFSLQALPTQKGSQEKPYFQTLIIFSSPENVQINLPTIIISTAQRANLSIEDQDYIIRRLQAAFYNIAWNWVKNHLDEDPATCISRIPLKKLQEAVRRELEQCGVTLNSDGVFAFRREPFLKLGTGADQCIRVKANLLFDILAFPHMNTEEEAAEERDAIRESRLKIGCIFQKLLDVMVN